MCAAPVLTCLPVKRGTSSREELEFSGRASVRQSTKVNQLSYLRTNFMQRSINRIRNGKIMEESQLSPMQPSKLTTQRPSIDEETSVNETAAEPSMPAESASATLLTDSFEQGKAMLNEHKGKLAIGVAATLGLMVFYKWREKKLAEEDPEEYARLQRIKAVVREQENDGLSTRAEDDD